MKITSAEFVASATEPGGWPDARLPEVAFLGRSNVGKSSLLNCLVGRKHLARVSSTPGRTRALNFFCVNRAWMFADLPGYGYARVSKEERRQWREMVETYLAGRKELKAVVLILDLRRAPGEEERDLVGWLTAHGLPFVLVATKADKLSRRERPPALARLCRGLGVGPEQVVVFSARTGEGRPELWKRIIQTPAENG